MGESPLFHPSQEDNRVLKPFSCMQRHQCDRTAVFAFIRQLVSVRYQRCRLQKPCQRGIGCSLLVFCRNRLQLGQVIYTRHILRVKRCTQLIQHPGLFQDLFNDHGRVPVILLRERSQPLHKVPEPLDWIKGPRGHTRYLLRLFYSLPECFNLFIPGNITAEE